MKAFAGGGGGGNPDPFPGVSSDGNNGLSMIGGLLVGQTGALGSVITLRAANLTDAQLAVTVFPGGTLIVSLDTASLWYSSGGNARKII